MTTLLKKLPKISPTEPKQRERAEPRPINIEITRIDDQRLEAIATVAAAVLELAKALNTSPSVNVVNNHIGTTGTGLEINFQTQTTTTTPVSHGDEVVKNMSWRDAEAKKAKQRRLERHLRQEMDRLNEE